jgi:hypothetical protein
MNRRSFLARFVALVAAPVSALLASRRPDSGTEARRPAPDLKQPTRVTDDDAQVFIAGHWRSLSDPNVTATNGQWHYEHERIAKIT